MYLTSGQANCATAVNFWEYNSNAGLKDEPHVSPTN